MYSPLLVIIVKYRHSLVDTVQYSSSDGNNPAEPETAHSISAIQFQPNPKRTTDSEGSGHIHEKRIEGTLEHPAAIMEVSSGRGSAIIGDRADG